MLPAIRSSSLLRYPSAFGFASTLGMAAAALAPPLLLAWSPQVFGMWAWQNADLTETLVTYLRFAGPLLLGVNAVGLLALMLALAQGLGLLGDRLGALLLRAGRRWSDTRALLAGLTLAGTAAVLVAAALLQATHTLDAAHRRFELRAERAWPQLIARLRAEAPPETMDLPAGDPRPALERLLAYPAVERAYAVSLDGKLTVLERGQAPRVTRLPSWHRTYGAGTYTARLPREQREREDFIELVAAHTAPVAFGQPEKRGRFASVWVWRGDHQVFEAWDDRHGRLGFELSSRFLRRELGDVLRQLELPGDVVFGYDSRGSLDNELESPWRLRHGWLAPRIMLHDMAASYEAERRTLQDVLPLLGLMLLLGALLIEDVRRLRAVWADRTIALSQSNFVSGVSHEMRTPLATIKLYAELMQGGLVEEPAPVLATIVAECDRLTRLIENVLDFARISGRKRDYAFARLDANAVADEALAAVAGPLAASALVLQRHVPEGLAFRGDHDAVVQALINLLSNAIKYAGEGGSLLLAIVPEGSGVAIMVQDFGPGIPDNEHKRIFQPFYRIGSELTRTATGSGLGLALVREHVTAHGGRVELQSAPGAGATFRLLLPGEVA